MQYKIAIDLVDGAGLDVLSTYDLEEAKTAANELRNAWLDCLAWSHELCPEKS